MRGTWYFLRFRTVRNLLWWLALGLSPIGMVYSQPPNADQVRVVKSEARMYLLRDGEAFRSYRVAFGANPTGHKQREGDERTPEGWYVLDYKKADSAFYKAIHISYPNEADRDRATHQGHDPGGAIMIHGQRNGLGWLAWLTQKFNWTDGCIAVTNAEMDEIWNLVEPGTPIEIVP
ncbi:MAG: L,D-transpeptidase family protein [Pseudomonadales bacterium]